MLSLIYAVAACALAVWYLVAFAGRAPRILKTLVKTGSVALLALAAQIAGGPEWLVLALVFGAVGDACLTVPTKPAFIAGLIAFGLSHLAYIALFLDYGAVPHLMTAWPVAIYGVVMMRQLWVPAGALRWAVLGYVIVISVMGMSVLMLPDPYRMAIFAGFAFVVSDSLLSKELFVWPDRHPARRWSPYAVWSLYWGAQAGFAWVFALSGAF